MYYVSVAAYFLGVWKVMETQWFPCTSNNDVEAWLEKSKKMMRWWCRSLCSYKLTFCEK